jgi:hypothetical protein
VFTRKGTLDLDFDEQDRGKKGWFIGRLEIAKGGKGRFGAAVLDDYSVRGISTSVGLSGKFFGQFLWRGIKRRVCVYIQLGDIKTKIFFKKGKIY